MAANNKAIGLLFEVEGGGNISGKTGTRINGQLRQIVGAINKSNTVNLKFRIDANYFKSELDKLKKQLDAIQNMQSQQGGGQNGNTKAIDAQVQAYKQYTATIKEWVSTQKEAARLDARNKDFNRNETTGDVSGTVAGYEKTIAKIQAVNAEMANFKATVDSVGGTSNAILTTDQQFESLGNQLGVTKEQARQLYNQMQAGNQQVAINTENAGRAAKEAWVKASSKIRDEINRNYHLYSKNPGTRQMADKMLADTKNAELGVNELQNRYDEFRTKVKESGVDIEGVGDRFDKAFRGKIRAALAGVMTLLATKFLRDIYKNVVEIDKAMVNLQIASGKTRDEVKELIKDYAELGRQLGASATDVAAGADTWLRQGYALADANTLIKNSTMLSKLGQMEAAEAAKALTSAMKGYNVTVDESIRIVDRFTAVDMVAAASAGDIATAMSETATSARIAGVSMDTLIGYLATVKEVTQDGAESVGTFFKTLFARMNNVKAGKFVDEETGESLNDVEAVLGKLGIRLRDMDGQFRSSSAVLDEVASKWNTFDTVAKRAIATSFAGKMGARVYRNVHLRTYLIAGNS